MDNAVVSQNYLSLSLQGHGEMLHIRKTSAECTVSAAGRCVVL